MENWQAKDQGNCNNNCRTDRPKDKANVARQMNNLPPKDQGHCNKATEYLTTQRTIKRVIRQLKIYNQNVKDIATKRLKNLQPKGQ